MRLTRIYQLAVLNEGAKIELDREASNHLINVLRLKVGASFIIFNGEGKEHQAVVDLADKKRVIATVGALVEKKTESPLITHLGQVVSRGEKMDWTIQKAVELGVTEITPLFSERCEVSLSQDRWDKKQEHWKKIMISASEQSSRTILPTLNRAEPFLSWISSVKETVKIILHPHEQNKTINQNKVDSVAVGVGPEGGFSDDEIRAAKEKGFVIHQCGPRILRTETAGLAMLSILQAKWGDF